MILSRCKSLESVVEHGSTAPGLLALILLRQDGYPCIFYGPTITAHTTNDKGQATAANTKFWLDSQPLASSTSSCLYAGNYATVDQVDYFDTPGHHSAGRRSGTRTTPAAWQVVLSSGDDGRKMDEVASPTAFFIDDHEHIQIASPLTRRRGNSSCKELRCQSGAEEN